MKETKQDQSIPKKGKTNSGKKRSTKGKTNPMGTAFDLSGSLITEPMVIVKKLRMPKQSQGAKQTPQPEKIVEKKAKKTSWT